MLDTLFAITLAALILVIIRYRRQLRRQWAQLEALVRLARKVGVSDAVIAGLVTGAMPTGMAPFEVLKALERERPHGGE